MRRQAMVSCNLSRPSIPWRCRLTALYLGSNISGRTAAPQPVEVLGESRLQYVQFVPLRRKVYFYENITQRARKPRKGDGHPFLQGPCLRWSATFNRSLPSPSIIPSIFARPYILNSAIYTPVLARQGIATDRACPLLPRRHTGFHVP